MSEWMDQTPWQPRTQARTRQLAWLGSLSMHLALVGMVVVSYRRAPERPAAVAEARSAGVALVRQIDGLAEYFNEEGVLGETSAAVAPPALDQFLPDDTELAIDRAGRLPTPGNRAVQAPSGLGPRVGEIVAQSGGPRGEVGTARTTVFGVEGEGNRFIYVFDRSGSMAGFDARPLRTAKAELLKSLSDLQPIHQFQIVFYNEKPRIFNPGGGRPQMMWGDAASKRLAQAFVNSISGTGSTDHLAALRKALALDPDVVFFLTDADEPQLTARELDTIQRLNRGCAIHAIEFGLGPQRSRQNFLTQLAAENGGQHVYVNIRDL